AGEPNALGRSGKPVTLHWTDDFRPSGAWSVSRYCTACRSRNAISCAQVSPRATKHLGVDSSGTDPPRSAGIPRSMRIHPRSVEKERDSEHDEEESEVHKREAPSTALVEAISELDLSLLVQCRHSQIDQDRGAHHQEAEVQEPVYQREIRNGRYQL